MKHLTLILLTATLGLNACKNTTKTIGSEKASITESTEDFKYDIIISFFSKSSGIDSELKIKVDNTIKSFNIEKNTHITPEIIPWGREGERDYLFVTKNLSTSQKASLVSQIKETVGSSEKVHLYFNKIAVHKR